MLWVLRVTTARIASIVLFCIQKPDFLAKFSFNPRFSVIILVDFMSFSTLINFL